MLPALFDPAEGTAVKAVLFDLWETLVHDLPDLSRARQLWRAANVRSVFRTAGIDIDLDTLDAALGTVLSRTLSAMQDEGRDVDGPGRVTLFAGELAALGGPTPGAALYEALEMAMCTMTHGLYPHRAPAAVETLIALKAQGLRTALVSNAGITTAPTLREMLDHYGLAPHLDAVAFSDEMQLAKPASGMFTAALEAIGCDPAEAVFVGDSPHNDVAGARSVGMLAVQIGHRQVDGIEPDAKITSLDELPGVLGRIARPGG